MQRGYSKNLNKWIYGTALELTNEDTNVSEICIFTGKVKKICSTYTPECYEVDRRSVQVSLDMWIDTQNEFKVQLFEGDIIFHTKTHDKHTLAKCSLVTGDYLRNCELKANSYKTECNSTQPKNCINRPEYRKRERQINEDVFIFLVELARELDFQMEIQDKSIKFVKEGCVGIYIPKIDAMYSVELNTLVLRNYVLTTIAQAW